MLSAQFPFCASPFSGKSEIGRSPRWTPPRIVEVKKYSTESGFTSTICLASGNGGFRLQSRGIGYVDGVVIVDHGSRRKESNLMLDEFVAMFRGKTGYPIVEPAHMVPVLLGCQYLPLLPAQGEVGATRVGFYGGPLWRLCIEGDIDKPVTSLRELAEPSIRDAFSLCVQQGANRVIVSPFFLFPGRHWHQDIPSLTAEAAKDHPGVSYLITAPLGLHELLVDVVNDRIKYCLSHVAGGADECSVCAGTGKCRLY